METFDGDVEERAAEAMRRLREFDREAAAAQEQREAAARAERERRRDLLGEFVDALPDVEEASRRLGVTRGRLYKVGVLPRPWMRRGRQIRREERS